MESDDELNYLNNKSITNKENIVTLIGTQKYKALLDAYKIFKYLKKTK